MKTITTTVKPSYRTTTIGSGLSKAFKKDEGYLYELHPHTVTHYLNRAKRKAGIKKKGSIHILRHSLGSDLISQGLSTRAIQDLLRHSKVTKTEIYTQLSKKALQLQLKGKKV